MLGRGGREKREWLGAQLPANTRAHSISLRPSDTTAQSRASAKKHAHTSAPCHRLYPLFRSFVVICSGNDIQARTRAHTTTHKIVPVACFTARGV